MSKPLSLTLLTVGIVLLLYGLNAGNSFTSQAKEALTGTPVDRSLILIGMGIIGVVVGGMSAHFRRHN